MNKGVKIKKCKRKKGTINKLCVYLISLLFYNIKRIVAFVTSIQCMLALYGG